MFNITSRFYVIYGDGVPIYVGYTNRTVKQRFAEHKEDKDFSDYEDVHVEELKEEKLVYDFTWNYEQTCKNADEVSLREGQLVQKYNTQDSIYQKADAGGQTWATEKGFVKSNKDNPKFLGMSGTQIKGRIKTEKEVLADIRNFVYNMKAPYQLDIGDFVNNMKIPYQLDIRDFVNNMNPQYQLDISHFVSHMNPQYLIDISTFVNNMKAQYQLDISHFVSHMNPQYLIDISHFISHMNPQYWGDIQNFVNSMKISYRVDISSFVSSIKYSYREDIKNFVSNMKEY